MKKLFALMLALVMMMSVVAVAEEAVPSPKAGAAIGSFTPDGIVPGVVNAEDDEALQKLVTAVEEAGDNDTVFGSSGVEGLSQYVLVELVGLTLDNYDESMGEVTLNISFASAFTQDMELLALLGLINGNEVTWQSVQFATEADGSLTITLTPEQAKDVAEGTAVLAILQKIA